MVCGWIKKIISVACVSAMTICLFACSVTENTTPAADAFDHNIKIGVSIWNTHDLLGERTKTVIDDTARALGVEVEYFEHEYDPNYVRTSVNRLCVDGCDGIIFCPSDNSDMRAAIRTCESEGVYLAQYYSHLTDEDRRINEQAIESEYYVGAVYEDEIENGYNLMYYLLNEGNRRIGIMCGVSDEVTFVSRRAGCELAVEEWNNAHPDDTVHLSQTVYAKSSQKSCNEAVDELLFKMRDMDGLVVGSGTGTQVVGALGALRDHDLLEQVDLVGTGFLNDMEKQLKHDGIHAESGGNINDPLFALTVTVPPVIYLTLSVGTEPPELLLPL